MTDSPIYSVNLTNRKILATLIFNYHMSIKKSQGILKYSIDLKNRVWFMLGSENEPYFVTVKTFSSSTAGEGVENPK